MHTCGTVSYHHCYAWALVGLQALRSVSTSRKSPRKLCLACFVLVSARPKCAAVLPGCNLIWMMIRCRLSRFQNWPILPTMLLWIHSRAKVISCFWFNHVNSINSFVGSNTLVSHDPERVWRNQADAKFPESFSCCCHLGLISGAWCSKGKGTVTFFDHDASS